MQEDETSRETTVLGHTVHDVSHVLHGRSGRSLPLPMSFMNTPDPVALAHEGKGRGYAYRYTAPQRQHPVPIH